MLYAEDGNPRAPGAGGKQQARGERAILLATFDDVPGLHENRLFANVFDLERIDVVGFVHFRGFLRQRLFERERHRPAAAVAVHKVDRKVSMNERPGNVLVVRAWRGPHYQADRQQHRTQKRSPTSAHLKLLSLSPQQATGGWSAERIGGIRSRRTHTIFLRAQIVA